MAVDDEVPENLLRPPSMAAPRVGGKAHRLGKSQVRPESVDLQLRSMYSDDVPSPHSGF